MKQLSAIVLAAGKGTRLNCKEKNKVMLPIAGTPMIGRTVSTLEKLNLNSIVVVVGFAHESIQTYLNNRVTYAVQKKVLGTANAVGKALNVIPSMVTTLLVLNGDDSYRYSVDLLKKLIDNHTKTDADVTLLTIEKNNPAGLGRIIRDTTGKVTGIVEEKDATNKQKKITEINPQCWVFKREFLAKYLPKVKKSSVTGEYYLVELVQIAVFEKKHIEAVKAGNMTWRGVNTKEEFEEANSLYQK